MSDLSAQLSAFKNKLKSGPSVAVARKAVISKPTSPLPTTSSNSSNTSSKRPNPTDPAIEVYKRHKPERADISGSHLSTQLHLAVEYIKEQDQPVSIGKLQQTLSFDVEHTLLPLLKEIDRVKYDENNRTLEYVSLHNIKTADDLLEFLRKQTTFKGISVKELKDGWAGCIRAIDDLEAEDKILVLRNKKENAPRLVWANAGGKVGAISDEFKRCGLMSNCLNLMFCTSH